MFLGRGEASGGCFDENVRGRGKGHSITNSEVEEKAEECGEGGDCCGKLEVLFNYFVNYKPLRYKS